MKAVQIVAIGADLRQADLRQPKPARGEVLIAVQAAGICHSDAHYRSGTGALSKLPITPGHEVAGIIAAVGDGVSASRVGERVCVHYLITCGHCEFCSGNRGQFCRQAQMIGKDVDGGYAEYIVVPSVNAMILPEEISFAAGAVMMCSFATSLHALRKARFVAGESVAIFGAGGLGAAAIRIATTLGASKVFAIDINADKVRQAVELGAIAIDAANEDVIQRIVADTDGAGVDVALELVGSPVTTSQAVGSLAVNGRAAIVGLSKDSTDLNMYRDLIGREREIIGVSDHLPSEIDELIGLARAGLLDAESVVSELVPLQATAINAVFARLDAHHGAAIRTVIEFSGFRADQT